jgi:hypothetical protein
MKKISFAPNIFKNVGFTSELYYARTNILCELKDIIATNIKIPINLQLHEKYISYNS